MCVMDLNKIGGVYMTSNKLLTPEEILNQLGTKLLEVYNVPKDYKVSHLKYSENFTYVISLEKTDTKYVLRVNRPGYHTKEELEGELIWIDQLNKDTNIPMAKVYKGKDGSLIQKINFSGTKDIYYCSLFSFVKGNTLRGLPEDKLEKYMYDIGKVAATLHRHVQNWDKANDLLRFNWDLYDLVGEGSRWGDWSLMKTLTNEQNAIFKEAVDIIRRRLAVYGKNSTNYGLIHSDLNINNILEDDGEIKVLDFDDCGYGWFMYDLSTSVLEYCSNLEKMSKAWLNGYETVRKLSNSDIEEIPTFLVLRKIVRIGWIATHYDNDTVKIVHKEYYDYTERLAKWYVDKYK